MKTTGDYPIDYQLAAHLQSLIEPMSDDQVANFRRELLHRLPVVIDQAAQAATVKPEPARDHSAWDASRPPNPRQVLFDTMLTESGWTPNDGEIPGYFRDRRAGYRCLWSCGWHTGRGMVLPDELLPVESMTAAQLSYEIQDIIDRGRPWREAQEMADDLLHGRGDPRQAVELVRRMRQGYHDFTWAPNPPLAAMAINVRPGWGSIDELRGKVRIGG